MEFHTPRSLAETHGIDVHAYRHRRRSRWAANVQALLRRISAAVRAFALDLGRRYTRRMPAATDGRSPRGENCHLARQELPTQSARRFNRVGAREVFVVTKDDVPYHATFSQHEASQIFDGIVHAGTFRQASVVAISTIQEYRRVLFEAGKAA